MSLDLDTTARLDRLRSRGVRTRERRVHHEAAMPTSVGIDTSGPPVDDQPPDRPAVSHRWRRDAHHWSRVVHVYTSMIALVVVLFFAATGLLLNHPGWTFGSQVETSSETGTLPVPSELTSADGTATGTPDYLSVAEYLRDEFGVIGGVQSFGETNGDGSIVFTNPGYRAAITFDVADGTYQLTVDQEGWVAALNDMHRGSSTGTAWRWVIDACAAFLVVISLTGLVMQFFLKKRRRSALIVAVVGTAVTAIVAMITLG